MGEDATPEGAEKKMTFAERREAARLREKEERSAAEGAPASASGGKSGGFKIPKIEHGSAGGGEGDRSKRGRDRSRSRSRDRKKHRSRRGRSASRSASRSSRSSSSSSSSSRRARKHRKHHRSSDRKSSDRKKKRRSSHGDDRDRDGARVTGFSAPHDAALSMNPALASMAAMVARDRVRAAAAAADSAGGGGDRDRDRGGDPRYGMGAGGGGDRDRGDRGGGAPTDPRRTGAAGGGDRGGGSPNEGNNAGGARDGGELAADIEMMKRISDAAKAVASRAAEELGITNVPPPPGMGMGPGAGSDFTLHGTNLGGGYADAGSGIGSGTGAGAAEDSLRFHPSMEGRLIGKGGSMIMELQTVHAVKLNVVRGEGLVQISGAALNIQRAKIAIERLCAPDAAALGSGPGAADAPGYITEVVDIGGHMEGRVIGSGGGTIRDIEARSGASVKARPPISDCSPYDRVRVVNADPRGLFHPAHLSAQGPSLTIPTRLDAFQLRF